MNYATYTVTMRKQFPPHDERDGIQSEQTAKSKADAIKQARRQMEHDGHSGRGFGRITFTAVKEETV